MAGEAAASELRFFLDRGLGARIVPQALRRAGWTLETMDERYGKAVSQEIRDTQWIEEAALAGEVLLCKDLEIAHNPLEAQVVYMTSARVFASPGRTCPGQTWHSGMRPMRQRSSQQLSEPTAPTSCRSTRHTACAGSSSHTRRSDMRHIAFTVRS